MRKLLALFTVLMLFNIIASAQTRVITGQVKDETGSPVPYASVKIKGTGLGTSADANGNFKIQAKTGDVLVISSAASETREITIGSGDVVNATLAAKKAQLAEVFITAALGIQRQPKEIGYATARIKADELTQAKVTNLATGLSSKVSGVDIRLTDNGVNPTVKINFRGNRSLTGNNTALVIVDGVPVNQNYIASLNPNDIDNVTILKGANAAALYGIEASNGVLIITTKKGGRGKLTLSVRNTTTFETVSYLPNLQTQYSSYGGEGGGFPDPEKGCQNCRSYIDPLTGAYLPVPFENQNFGTAYDSKDFPYTIFPISGPDANGKITYGPFRPYANAKKSFFQTGIGVQNDISGSVGNKWGGLYFSGQNVNNTGVVYNDSYKRTGGRINGNATFGRFSATAAINYSQSKVDITGSDQLQGRQVYFNVINQPAHLNLGDFKNVDSDPKANPNNYINAYYPNPWWQVFHSRAKSSSNNLVTSLQLNYKILDWLSVTARGGYSQTKRDAPAHIDSITYAPYAIADPWGGGNIASSYQQRKYQYEDVKVNFSDLNTDAFLTAKYKWKKYSISLIAGGNYRARNSDGEWYSNEAYSRIGFTTRVDDPRGGGFAKLSYKARDFAAYGDLTLGYDEWFYVHGSFRNDWTSVLDPRVRSFSYPAVDISAVLHEKIEALKNSNTVSFLKLRAGYAITGNISLPNSDGIFMGSLGGAFLPYFGAYAIYPTVQNGNGFPYGTLNGYTQNNRNVQDKLRPEKSFSAEAGFEIGLLRDRIRFEAVYYHQSVKDQTVSLKTATSTGTTDFLRNTGEILNQGLEFDLRLTPLFTIGRFRWNLNVNYTHLDNKVRSLVPELGINELQLAGTPNGFFGGGIYAITGNDYPVIKTTDFVRDPQGRIIVDGTTGLPTKDPQLKVFGNTNYTDRFGLSSNMSWNGFTLNAVFDYRGGAKIWNALGADLDFTGISANSAQNRQRFVIPNSVYLDGNGKYVPNTSITINDGSLGWWASNYNRIGAPYVNSGAFWKLRELALGYDFPSRMLAGAKVIKKLTVSLIGRNLFMWRPSTNIWTDPEFSNAGIGNAVGTTTVDQTPPTRILGFSVNVTF